MPVLNAIASVAVRNLTSSIPWYEQLFGRAPDLRPAPELAQWHFEHGGGLQVYQLFERAGKGSATLAVSNLDEQTARLRRLGIDPGKTLVNPQVRVVMIKDPDGNSLAFAEARNGSSDR